MAHIALKLFGTPGICKDGKPIVLPFRKAEAVIYFLAVNGKASREELAGLLWGEADETSARKCLRDALYKIHRTLDITHLFSAEKHIVAFSDDISISSDIHTFVHSDNLDQAIHAYSGDFLSGFNINETPAFDQWTRTHRLEFRELYIKKLYRCIEKNTQTPDNHTESYARMIIQADEFDENAYRILMKLFADRGAFNKAVELYNHLLELLEEELGITPDTETQKLYTKIMGLRRSTHLHHADSLPHLPEYFFFGRGSELISLENEYSFFIHPHPRKPKSILISGEAGVGKTKLKDRFILSLPQHSFSLIETHCYPGEENYLLKPWNPALAKILDILEKNHAPIPPMWETIIAEVFPFLSPLSSRHPDTFLKPVEKTGALKPAVIEETILHLIHAATQIKKILLVFEDLQWIDSMSLSLVSRLLLKEEASHILFIGTLRSGHNENIDRFLTIMNRYNKLKQIDLLPFSRQESFDFISLALPNYSMELSLKDLIYKETEGNPFFIVECLNLLREKKDIAFNAMTPRMQGILESRIMDISASAKKLLNIMSLFIDHIDLDLLQHVSGKNESQLLDMIEELKQRFIIREFAGENHVYYDFTHHKLRDFVYSRLSLGRRKLLHNKIGSILERFLENDKRDIVLYPRLIYHFSNGRELLAALKYSIKNARVYLDVSHDLFPELNRCRGDKNNYLQGTSRQASQKYMNDIRILLEKVKESGPETHDIISLEMEFLYIQGRYLIMEGDYDTGVPVIQRVIEGANRVGNYRQALKAHIQMIFYAYQAHLDSIMTQHLQAAGQIVDSCDSPQDKGILMRLKALQLIMTGYFDQAESLLHDSIEWFRRLDPGDDTYALHIAAAFNYIGDIRRNNLQFAAALEMYAKAIDISREKQAISSLASFYTNAGQAAYEMGDYPTAYSFFNQAIDMYNNFDTLWGRSNAEGYFTLLLIEENKYPAALEFLQRALFYAEKLKNPYRLGLVKRFMAIVRRRMDTDQTMRHIFQGFLNQPFSVYVEQAVQLFRQTNSTYELNLLEQLR